MPRPHERQMGPAVLPVWLESDRVALLRDELSRILRVHELTLERDVRIYGRQLDGHALQLYGGIHFERNVRPAKQAVLWIRVQYTMLGDPTRNWGPLEPERPP